MGAPPCRERVMERYGLNLDHPEILKAILTGIVETGDVIGRAGPRRTVLAVTVDDWVIDELAALGAEPEDLEDPEVAGQAVTSEGPCRAHDPARRPASRGPCCESA